MHDQGRVSVGGTGPGALPGGVGRGTVEDACLTVIGHIKSLRISLDSNVPKIDVAFDQFALNVNVPAERLPRACGAVLPWTREPNKVLPLLLFAAF